MNGTDVEIGTLKDESKAEFEKVVKICFSAFLKNLFPGRNWWTNIHQRPNGLQTRESFILVEVEHQQRPSKGSKQWEEMDLAGNLRHPDLLHAHCRPRLLQLWPLAAGQKPDEEAAQEVGPTPVMLGLGILMRPASRAPVRVRYPRVDRTPSRAWSWLQWMRRTSRKEGFETPGPSIHLENLESWWRLNLLPSFLFPRLEVRKLRNHPRAGKLNQKRSRLWKVLDWKGQERLLKISKSRRGRRSSHLGRFIWSLWIIWIKVISIFDPINQLNCGLLIFYENDIFQFQFQFQFSINLSRLDFWSRIPITSHPVIIKTFQGPKVRIWIWNS